MDIIAAPPMGPCPAEERAGQSLPPGHKDISSPTMDSPPVQEAGPRPGLKEEIVLVFPSTTTVLNAEDVLEERGLVFELIPVPKAVNPNCGLAISFDDGARPEIMRALAEAALRPSAAYLRRGEEFEPWGNRPFPAAAPQAS